MCNVMCMPHYGMNEEDIIVSPFHVDLNSIWLFFPNFGFGPCCNLCIPAGLLSVQNKSMLASSFGHNTCFPMLYTIIKNKSILA